MELVEYLQVLKRGRQAFGDGLAFDQGSFIGSTLPLL